MTALVEARDLFRVYPSPDGRRRRAAGADARRSREGEICVVLGPSGSGKSTLCGSSRASTGRRRASVTRRRARRRRRSSPREPARYRAELLGYADQHYWRALAGELTARGARRRPARARAALPRRARGAGPASCSSASASPTAATRQAARALRRRAAARRALRRARAPARGCSSPTSRPASSMRRRAREVFALIAELVREGGAHGTRRQPRPGVGRVRRPGRPRPRRAGQRRAAGRRRGRRSSSAAAAGCASRRSCSARRASRSGRRCACAADELVVAAPDGDGLRDPGTQAPPETAHRTRIEESLCSRNTSSRRGARPHAQLRRGDADRRARRLVRARASSSP